MLRMRVLVAGALAMLLLAACGDGDPTPDTTLPDPQESTTTVLIDPTTSSTTSTTVTAARSVRAVSPQPMQPSGDPDDIATRITSSEQALRSSSTPEAEMGPYADRQQRAYREVSADSRLVEPVVSRVPSELRSAARANITAGAELRALTKPKSSLPKWRIVEPAPAEELVSYYREAESRYGVPWNYLASIHLVETRMGRIRGTSSAGAQGPMQFMPATWEQYGEGGDINDNRDSIMAAARYLKRNGAPERMANALYAYNRSDRYVKAVTLYAEQIASHQRAYTAYHGWQVWYRLTSGDVLLPVGYEG